MSSAPSQYDTDFLNQPIDVSASTRKFQTSVIVKQDVNKNGILSFLEGTEKEVPSPPTRQAPQAMRPGGQGSSGGSGY